MYIRENRKYHHTKHNNNAEARESSLPVLEISLSTALSRLQTLECAMDAERDRSMKRASLDRWHLWPSLQVR